MQPAQIGFGAMPAMVMISGMISTQISQTEAYEAERAQLITIVEAYANIISVPPRTRKFIEGLLQRAMYEWWQTSLFNVQVNAVCEDVMAALEKTLHSCGITTIRRVGYTYEVSGVTATRYSKLEAIIKDTHPGLSFYYEPSAVIVSGFAFNDRSALESALSRSLVGGEKY